MRFYDFGWLESALTVGVENFQQSVSDLSGCVPHIFLALTHESLQKQVAEKRYHKLARSDLVALSAAEVLEVGACRENVAQLGLPPVHGLVLRELPKGHILNLNLHP